MTDGALMRWKVQTVKQPKLDVLYVELVYKPMLELLELLHLLRKSPASAGKRSGGEERARSLTCDSQSERCSLSASP